MKKIVYMILCLFFVSCQEYNEKLETALQLAGENREELEKVLQHYSQNPSDSLKLKAATFLIENMPGHYSFDGQLVNRVREKINRDTTHSYYAKKELHIILGHFSEIKHTSQKKEDVQHVKADFLIRHIDASFEMLDNYPWLTDLPFDLFFEYLLPYRFEHESLDLWRDSLHVSSVVLKECEYKGNEKYSILKHSSVKLEEPCIDAVYPYSLIPLTRRPKIDCHDEFFKTIFRYRVRGIPATLDFIPHYANRNGYHCWAAMMLPDMKNNDRHHFPAGKTGKVYRLTFSKRNDITPWENEFMPELFRAPFFKDVTHIYLNTGNASIPVRHKLHGNPYYAYLCVFNNLNWQPIAITKLEKKLAEFKDLGKDIVYLPVYYAKNRMYSLNYPFILNLRGEVKTLIPDTCTKQSIRLIRKYPSSFSSYCYSQAIEGKFIEASNSKTFREKDSILEFQSPNMVYYDQKTNTGKSYRYCRLVNDSLAFYIAELVFIDAKGQVLKGNMTPEYQKITDNDPLTSVGVTKGKPLVIDFGKPVEIARITCVLRGDGNGIYPGNEYELFYYDSNGWRSIGHQVASDYFLEYDNLPSGALYWLRNQTTGIEERIFTIEDGNVRFW